MSLLAKNARVNGGPPGSTTACARSRVVGLKSRHNTVDAAASISLFYPLTRACLRRPFAGRGMECLQRGRGPAALRQADHRRRAVEHAGGEVFDLSDEQLRRSRHRDPFNPALAFEL